MWRLSFPVWLWLLFWQPDALFGTLNPIIPELPVQLRCARVFIYLFTCVAIVHTVENLEIFLYSKKFFVLTEKNNEVDGN